ncbi:hypothetical protein F0562_022435 [Nyssa sinensis]|uniref:Uncharacterized protein n=1 Tax=Nyssa sinensis TaxID=561372 RepID=A0A5J5BMS3_9ASTE|nr:hypothetical protein F0562_022435 [Nyssa sinensis]
MMDTIGGMLEIAVKTQRDCSQTRRGYVKTIQKRANDHLRYLKEAVEQACVLGSTDSRRQLWQPRTTNYVAVAVGDGDMLWSEVDEDREFEGR